MRELRLRLTVARTVKQKCFWPSWPLSNID